MPTHMSDTLTRLPPAPTLVYKILEFQGPLTYSELLDEAKLPESTLKDALQTLRDHDLVVRQYHSDDARSHLYATN